MSLSPKLRNLAREFAREITDDQRGSEHDYDRKLGINEMAVMSWILRVLCANSSHESTLSALPTDQAPGLAGRPEERKGEPTVEGQFVRTSPFDPAVKWLDSASVTFSGQSGGDLRQAIRATMRSTPAPQPSREP